MEHTLKEKLDNIEQILYAIYEELQKDKQKIEEIENELNDDEELNER